MNRIKHIQKHTDYEEKLANEINIKLKKKDNYNQNNDFLVDIFCDSL